MWSFANRRMFSIEERSDEDKRLPPMNPKRFNALQKIKLKLFDL